MCFLQCKRLVIICKVLIIYASDMKVCIDRLCEIQADIYSLGVLLWELVTSDVPERGRMRPVKVHSPLTSAI